MSTLNAKPVGKSITIWFNLGMAILEILQSFGVIPRMAEPGTMFGSLVGGNVLIRSLVTSHPLTTQKAAKKLAKKVAD